MACISSTLPLVSVILSATHSFDQAAEGIKKNEDVQFGDESCKWVWETKRLPNIVQGEPDKAAAVTRATLKTTSPSLAIFLQ